MNEQEVKQRFEAIFPGKSGKVDHRLLGGMSNYTYVMEMEGAFYTYRIPGDHAEAFVDRHIEWENIKLMNELHISNVTIYFNVETGEKVAKYLPGNSLHQLDVYPLHHVAALLKKIHNSPNLAKNDYDPFGRLQKYEQHIIDLGFVHSDTYHTVKNRFMVYADYLKSLPKVLCHGDSQPSNFIIDYDQLFSVDFEFSGNNDLMYDIACFANIRIQDGLDLLHVYYEEVTDELLRRFYLWRTFQALQWHNVAVFKDLKGMSQKLKIDFNAVSGKYLALADDLMKKIEELSKNSLHS